jgi:hypothetical protein
MCLICTSLDKNTITFEEAWRNLREIKPTITEEHLKEVQNRIFEGFSKENYCLFCASKDCVCNWDEWESYYS